MNKKLNDELVGVIGILIGLAIIICTLGLLMLEYIFPDNNENMYIEKCPICNTTVELIENTNDRSYYLLCNTEKGGCGLHTNTYDNKKVLITIWNNYARHIKERTP